MTFFQTRFKKEKRWICACKRINDPEDERCAFCGEPKQVKPVLTHHPKSKICAECGIEFYPISHGGINKFCSNKCSANHQWKTRERKAKKIHTKICSNCGKEYQRHPKASADQWLKSKFCGFQCSANTKKINDGMTNRERGNRRRGKVKKFTTEWIEKIKARTKEGMMRPDVMDKLKQPRSPMSIENRIIRSDALAGIMPKNITNGGQYPNVQRGTYSCSKGEQYFRSKWEANYALYLDFLIKQAEILNWEYEADVFFFEEIRLGTRSYRPDFKIFNTDGSIEYHEVKGYMDAKSKTKLKRMAKYFPEIKLILVERDFYQSILKKLKGIIKFY